jgi:hypothetical protein
MEKVYVFKNSSGTYRVEPGIVVLTGGETLRVINASAVNVKVVIPKGAVKPPVMQQIEPSGRADFVTKSQGHGHIKAFSYKVTTSSGKKAQANSDPILIIEN